jgi:deoxycytidylate deaminase
MQDWDKYYMGVAKQVAQNSKCMSRKIGAVIVKDNCIIGTGYNGSPKGVQHCENRSFSFYNYFENRQYFKENDKIGDI